MSLPLRSTVSSNSTSGWLPDEIGQHFRQQRRHEILRRTEPQPAAQFGAGEIALRPFVRRQDAAGESDHGLSVRRGTTEWVSRTNSRRPASSSSLRMCWLTVDWRRPSAAVRLGETPGLRDREESLSRTGSSMAIALSQNYDYNNNDKQASQ